MSRAGVAKSCIKIIGLFSITQMVMTLNGSFPLIVEVGDLSYLFNMSNYNLRRM